MRSGGNVQRVVDPLGNTHALTYEAVFNRLTSMNTPGGSSSQFEYDGHGNVTAIIDTLGNRWVIAYDTTGAPIRVTDPLGNSVTFAYDAVGNLTGLTDPLGNTVTREYDGASRLLREASPRGKTTRLAYDPLDRVTSVIDPLGGTTRFSYDPNGNLLTFTDPGGSVTTHAYDLMDRVGQRTDPLGRVWSYLYDGRGNPTQATDPKGQVVTFTYDVLNRRTRAAYSDGAVVEFEYDVAGRLARMVNADDVVVHQYDALGRIVREITAYGAIEYGYDAWGRRVSMLVDASLFTYAYDGASRLQGITLAGVGSAGFDYDALGRVVRLALPNGVATAYAYDALSRPIELVYESGAGRLGNLTYRYDAGGNRTAIGGSRGRTLLPGPAAAATYDAAHQQLTFGGWTMSYDANGNLVSLGDAGGMTTFTYDAQDRLIQVDGGGGITRFTYDALGRRTARTVDVQETRFQHDATDVIRERTAGAEIVYLRGLGMDQTFFRGQEAGYLTDATNNTIALTDRAGNIGQTYSYEPFGRTETTGPAAVNTYQYTGREREGGDLYYYRARYYHAGLGRFIQPDPLGLLAGSNPYAYAENNPVNFLDPSGLRTYVAHGTSSGPGRLDEFRAALHKADPKTKVLEWSGKLTETVPSTDVPAAELFNKIIADLQADPLKPGEKLNLIGHSGGGIAFVKVAHMLRARGIKVSNLILFGTPLFPELVNPMLPPGVRVTNFVGLFDPLAWPLLLPSVHNIFVLNTLPNPFSAAVTAYKAHTGYAENQTMIRTIQDLIR